MKKQTLLYFIIATLLLTGCIELDFNKKTLESFSNRYLVNWYEKSFYPSIENLKTKSPRYFHSYKRVENNFLGLKISYDPKSSGLKVSSNEGQEKMDAAKENYRFINEGALASYKSYIKNRKGELTLHKPLLTKKIAQQLNPKIIYGSDIKGCDYGRMYIGKINNRIDSAFVNIICYEESAHPLFKGNLYIQPLSIVGVINGNHVQRNIDLMPNSILKETFIKKF